MHDARSLIASLRGQAPRREAVEDLRETLAEFIQGVNTGALDFALAVDPHAVALLSDGARHELLRICQEAINNVVKHSGAEQVAVQVGFDAARPGWVYASVQDDGHGFVVPTGGSTHGDGTAGGFGLRGMQERVAHVGGTLEIESRPGAGTTVCVKMPVRA